MNKNGLLFESSPRGREQQWPDGVHAEAEAGGEVPRHGRAGRGEGAPARPLRFADEPHPRATGARRWRRWRWQLRRGGDRGEGGGGLHGPRRAGGALPRGGAPRGVRHAGYGGRLRAGVRRGQARRPLQPQRHADAARRVPRLGDARAAHVFTCRPGRHDRRPSVAPARARGRGRPPQPRPRSGGRRAHARGGDGDADGPERPHAARSARRDAAAAAHRARGQARVAPRCGAVHRRGADAALPAHLRGPRAALLRAGAAALALQRA